MPLLKLFSIFTLKDTVKRSRGARCVLSSERWRQFTKRSPLGAVVKGQAPKALPPPPIRKPSLSPFFASFPIPRDRGKLKHFQKHQAIDICVNIVHPSGIYRVVILRRDKMHSRYWSRAVSPRPLSNVTPYHDAATEDSVDSVGSLSSLKSQISFFSSFSFLLI